MGWKILVFERAKGVSTKGFTGINVKVRENSDLNIKNQTTGKIRQRIANKLKLKIYRKKLPRLDLRTEWAKELKAPRSNRKNQENRERAQKHERKVLSWVVKESELLESLRKIEKWVCVTSSWLLCRGRAVATRNILYPRRAPKAKRIRKEGFEEKNQRSRRNFEEIGE